VRRPWFDARPLVVLAPMEGITDSPCRRISRLVSPDAVLFTEFTSARGLLHGNERTWKMVHFEPEERPLVVQIFGSSPEDMAAAAREVEARLRPDGIDINFGCPVRKVTGRGEGCGLMRDPARAALVVRATKDALHATPLSAKIRLGWERREEAVPFALALEEAGADLVTVHGRLRKERPRDPADWEAIARVKRALRVPVIGNGDIASGADARRRIEESGVDGVMIARAAMGNPWVLAEIVAALRGEPSPEAPGIDEKIRLILRHLDLNIAHHGDRRGVLAMRAHFGDYFSGFPGAKELRTRLNDLSTRDDVLTLLEPLLQLV